jgi:hypothetical protein
MGSEARTTNHEGNQAMTKLIQSIETGAAAATNRQQYLTIQAENTKKMIAYLLSYPWITEAHYGIKEERALLAHIEGMMA